MCIVLVRLNVVGDVVWDVLVRLNVVELLCALCL